MEDKSRFTLEDWDAPVYIGADELRHALVHMQLENKVIYGYRLLDYSAVQLPRASSSICRISRYSVSL